MRIDKIIVRISVLRCFYAEKNWLIQPNRLMQRSIVKSERQDAFHRKTWHGMAKLSPNPGVHLLDGIQNEKLRLSVTFSNFISLLPYAMRTNNLWC